MKIIMATGGTGGHIFPALNVAAQLKADGHDVCFVGVFGPTKTRIVEEGYLLEELDAKGLITDSWRKTLGFALSMIKSIVMSFRILRRIKPDVILGFGGYGAFPIVFAGALCRVPTIIHEQNVLPGKANAVLGRMAKRIAISFEQSRKYFNARKTVFTGCPCRPVVIKKDRKELLNEFCLEEGRFTILVLGGSQGSQRINLEIMKTVPMLKDLLDFQIIHLSGAKDYDHLSEEYKHAGLPYYLASFLSEIEKAYSVADLVIARAGALTVTELAAFKRPAVLIPYPYAGGHQKENAMVLVEKGTAKMIEEKDLSPEALKSLILSFARSPLSRAALQTRLRGIYNADAALNLAGEVVKLK